MSNLQSLTFQVKEVPVTLDTPQGDVPTDYKLIVREDTNNILSCMTNDYKVVTNKEIIELQKRMEDLKTNERKLGNTNINNALFVGSTADLQKMLRDNK